jgi:copper(I)-binding protein
MKKTIFATLLAYGGVSFACPAHTGGTEAVLDAVPVQMAHAGHDHSAHQAAAHAPATNSQAVISDTLSVSACWIRSLPAPTPSAGYFVVKNAGAASVKLQGASSPSYGMVMLHQTTNEGGMSRMSTTHEIDISAGGELEFKPGGYHAMLEKPVQVPAVGTQVPFEFFFDNGEKATAMCEVKSARTLPN